MPSKLFGLRTVAGRVRALTALALLALAVLLTVTAVGAGDAREGLRALGHREGPMVVATSDMYLALSDMDAQVTNVLLTGGEDGWLCDPDERDCERSGERHAYDIRREDAQRAALQAALLARDDPERLRTVQSVLDGLHAYDQHVRAAMESGRRRGGPAAALPDEGVQRYRAATGLMTRNLLPKAYNLTLDGAADVDDAYRDEHAAVRAGWFRVLGAGIALLAALGALQVYLARRFRRLLSLPLAAALAGALVLTVAGASLLATEADHMRAAKASGFDPVLTLTRARAIGKGLDTDRARQLLDPAQADRYDQMYLEKSQTILYIEGATSLAAYYRELDARVARVSRDGGAVTFGGFYGTRARLAAADAGALLAGYREYQDHDRAVRSLAESGRRVAAVRAHLDPRWAPLPHPAFRAHDQELDARISHHDFLRARSVANGDRALDPWTWLAPAAALAIAALIAAGVWPRLSEYR
ncbi:hypothetical protein [Actinomadura latina]|uniref:Uncharacterized protein n=1 Tax=Actinomadura latina TaxID=163603 RepID=A0A846Z5T7_9ACTN|nr:hypothetical protein [Actinomadura latina]NKZ06602.1 hypothetical protein [Actinomadura latina]